MDEAGEGRADAEALNTTNRNSRDIGSWIENTRVRIVDEGIGGECSVCGANTDLTIAVVHCKFHANVGGV